MIFLSERERRGRRERFREREEEEEEERKKRNVINVTKKSTDLCESLTSPPKGMDKAHLHEGQRDCFLHH